VFWLTSFPTRGQSPDETERNFVNAMTRSKKPGTFRHILIGAVIIAITGGVLGLMQHLQIRHDINVANERNNVLLARVFANLVWPGVRKLVDTAHGLPADTLKKHPIVQQTHRRALELAKDVPLLKIKVYDLNALSVFSTDAEDIGETETDSEGYASARNGKVASVLERRKTFTALNGPVQDRDVLSSYVPVVGDSGKIEGVFEIYTDVTGPMAQARISAMLQLAFVGLAFLLVFVMGVQLIRRRDRTIAEIHAEQLRLTEATVAAEEANRTKSALLANMSHELRTPLNAVIGFAETMRMQPFGPIGSAKYMTYLEDIWRSGRHLLGIVDNVLEMARIDDGTAKLQITGVPVSDLIAAAVHDVEGRSVEPLAPIRTHGLRSPMTVLVDERRIRQVLVQLLGNARKFTPPHGSIEISVRQNRQGSLEFTVTDTGIGMAPEDVEAALLPFGRMDAPYAQASRGTQLGLPLARMLMELHGGTIAVQSVLGKGTSVTATLPFRCIVVDNEPVIRTSYDS
jgi:signal transduction histidine kinase